MISVDAMNEYLPFIIPFVILEVALALIAVIHICTHPKYRFGNKVLWIVLALFIQFIGPVLYFAVGRGEE